MLLPLLLPVPPGGIPVQMEPAAVPISGTSTIAAATSTTVSYAVT